MNREGQTPIDEKFLDESDLFGIRFNEGFVFMEVDTWEEVHFKPYDNVGSVASQDNSGYNPLEDPDKADDEILFVPSGQLKVIHAGIGHFPSMIRRYTRYDEGTLQLRQLPNLTTSSPRTGHDFGYVDGDLSPYNNPTDVEELLVVPDTSPHFDFYNPDPDRAHTPILHIAMRVYSVTPLDNNEQSDRSAIQRIVRPGSAPPVFNAGALTNQINYEMESDWGVSPIAPNVVEQIRRGNNG